MHKTILTLIAAVGTWLSAQAQPTVSSPTEGRITADFVAESRMKDGLMQMLARFATYLNNGFEDARGLNSRGEAYGCFRSNNTWRNNEDGVRSNADLGMVTAFLCKYGRGRVTLPEGITWETMERMAMRSLVFAYSTHKANRLAACEGNTYWGSTSVKDNQWESSLWAMSVAYSAFFLWDKLSEPQKKSIEALLKAECNYELERDIPTGYKGDTKAEENGWEADVLAATLGLFPDDALAPQWFDRLRRFAINAYSHRSDATDTTVIDPHYDRTTVKDLHVGINLYDDYTLQNHDYFHTSYQNVVIQELGEAALALRLFQEGLHGTVKWKTNALMHNNAAVQKHVLNHLALADGELAMPNGNDWSLFLYDQITSYATNATFLGDADALMLENLAYKMIEARQTTTPDGSWLLRSDIGARRMGVQAHRVMMTWLMHEVNSTADMQPSTFDDFRRRHAAAMHFGSQDIIRAYTPHRFTTFSWAGGIGSYTGYIAANSPDKNKIVVPFKSGNTGNFLGWYTVEGKKTNAEDIAHNHRTDGCAWVVNGRLHTNERTLDHRFAIYSTPGNAVIYTDYVSALADATITREQGGLMAISTDEFTRIRRMLYTRGQTDDTPTMQTETDGATLQTFGTDWINIDHALGIVGTDDKKMAFGDRANNNSIMTSKLYAAYSDTPRHVKEGDKVDARMVVYYSNIGAEDTRRMSREARSLRHNLPEGWNGAMAADPDGTFYLLVSNFKGAEKGVVDGLTTTWGAPVVDVKTRIQDGRSSATFTLGQNRSAAQAVRFFVKGSAVEAVAHDDTLILTAARKRRVTVISPECHPIEVVVGRQNATAVRLQNGKLAIENMGKAFAGKRRK